LLPGRSVLDIAPPPADVAPPPTVLAGIGLIVLAALGFLVVVIAVIAFFVIRTIRKNRAAKETVLEGPKENS
ncbi:MAG TPA: hypothetical protein VMS73_03745, partial [Anaerolineaceae bacterium]|nr:hypothetical protein [Anaerolineaceae bacterium]